VKLALYEGEALVSRSQAKRLSMRFERFRYVVLDFSGVKEICQAFADELFRIFAEAHPQVLLTWINTTDSVENMIKRVSFLLAPRQCSEAGEGIGTDEGLDPEELIFIRHFEERAHLLFELAEYRRRGRTWDRS